MGDEVLVLESEGMLEGPLGNPQEPLYFIPFTQGKDRLSLRQRLDLVAKELNELEEECEAEPGQQGAVQELAHLSRTAENRLTGANGTVAASLTNALLGAPVPSVAYTLHCTVPEAEKPEDLTEKIQRLSDALGPWDSESPFYDISQGLSYIRKKLCYLSSKNPELLNFQMHNATLQLNTVSAKYSALIEDDKPVHELFEFLEKIEDSRPVLTEVLRRLEVAERVSDETSQFNERVAQLTSKLSTIQSEIDLCSSSELSIQWEQFKGSVIDSFSAFQQKFANL